MVLILLFLIIISGYAYYKKRQAEEMINFILILLPQVLPFDQVITTFNQKFKTSLVLQQEQLILPSQWNFKEYLAYNLLLKFTPVFQTLYDSQKSLTQATKLSTLGEMAAGLAHEINNPIAIIQGIAYLIKDKLQAPEIDLDNLSQKTQLIIDTTQRMDKIVNGLRYFVQDDSRNPYEIATIQEIIDSVQVLSIDKCNKLGVRVETNLTDPEAVLYCKPIQISQVLINLVNNACDAIKDTDNPWIKLSVQENNQNFIFIVQDSGLGIPLELQDKILQPFFTNKLTTKSSGMGLGLSIAKRIINQHQGQIDIDSSNPNTTFIVTIPKKEQP